MAHTYQTVLDDAPHRMTHRTDLRSVNKRNRETLADTVGDLSVSGRGRGRVPLRFGYGNIFTRRDLLYENLPGLPFFAGVLLLGFGR